MNYVIRALISMYPKVWRDRYRREFEALLDDVSPTWSTLFDVFGGAVKMQVKIWSAWKIVAAFAVAGVVGSAAFTMTIPKRYVSTAVVRTGDTTEQEFKQTARMLESKAYLTQLIKEEGLYKAERARMTVDDVVEEMKQKDIRVKQVPGTAPTAVAVSFSSTDAAEAQRTTERLAAHMVEAHLGTVVDPATLPVKADDPRLSRNMVMGLILGVVLGSLFALFAGLKVWKLAAGMGMAGALAGAVIAYALPDRFVSQAVLRFSGSNQATARDRVQRLVEAITADESLKQVVHVQRYNLYANESDKERRLREHLHFSFTSDGRVLLIRFDDRDRYTARMVTADVVSRLMEEGFHNRAGADAKMTLELLDAPNLPLGPFSPNRPVAAGTGVLVGFAAAMMLGFWRRYKGSVPAAAAL